MFLVNFFFKQKTAYYMRISDWSSDVCSSDLAYITNQGSNDVSVIDVKTDKVIATIPVGKSPVGIAIAPKFSRAFVSNVDGRSISVIDTSSQIGRASRRERVCKCV